MTLLSPLKTVLPDWECDKSGCHLGNHNSVNKRKKWYWLGKNVNHSFTFIRRKNDKVLLEEVKHLSIFPNNSVKMGHLEIKEKSHLSLSSWNWHTNWFFFFCLLIFAKIQYRSEESKTAVFVTKSQESLSNVMWVAKQILLSTIHCR